MGEKRRNGGYEIIQAVKVTPKTEIVLGENLNNPITPYVVWTCFNETDYQWGHYYGSYLASLADLGTAIQTKALEYKEQLAGRGCKDNKKPFFDEKDCLPDCQQAVYEHQVIVLSPACLAHVYRHPSQQLYLATSVNGCRPDAKGQADKPGRWPERSLGTSSVHRDFGPGEDTFLGKKEPGTDTPTGEEGTARTGSRALMFCGKQVPNMGQDKDRQGYLWAGRHQML